MIAIARLSSSESYLLGSKETNVKPVTRSGKYPPLKLQSPRDEFNQAGRTGERRNDASRAMPLDRVRCAYWPECMPPLLNCFPIMRQREGKHLPERRRLQFIIACVDTTRLPAYRNKRQ